MITDGVHKFSSPQPPAKWHSGGRYQDAFAFQRSQDEWQHCDVTFAGFVCSKTRSGWLYSLHKWGSSSFPIFGTWNTPAKMKLQRHGKCDNDISWTSRVMIIPPWHLLWLQYFLMTMRWAEHVARKGKTRNTYGMITNDVSDYRNLLVRITHIICNHSSYVILIVKPEGKRIRKIWA
jgi:hypothetical protein